MATLGAPYRPPCPGWASAGARYRGGCWQHRLAVDASVGKWENATRVGDYRSPEDPEYSGTGIAPYPRKSDGSTWPVSEGCPTSPCNPDAVGEPKCNEWPTEEANDPVYGCIIGENFTVRGEDSAGDWGNCYHNASPATLDLSQCRKTGFKNVQARKFWHGRFGFLSHDPAGRIDRRMDPVVTGDPDVDCTTDTESEQPSHDTTKYRKIVYSIAYTSVDADSPGTEEIEAGGTYSAEISRGRQVTDYGILSETDCAISGDTYGRLGAKNILNPLLGTGAELGASRLGIYLDTWTTRGWTITFTRTGSLLTVTAKDGADTRGVATLDEASSSLTFSVEHWGTREPSMTWDVLVTEDFTCTNTGWTYVVHKESYGTYFTTTDYTVTATLSVSYTQADLQEDLYALLGEWDMTNDAQYPWRQDGQVGIAPLVTINEPEGAVFPEVDSVSSACGEYTDPNADVYDGGIRGKPLPAGYGPHFDWRHRTWKFCDDADGNHIPYIYAYGAWGHETPAGDPAVYSTGDTTDLDVPLTATQWTENYYPIAGFLPGVLDGGTEGLVAAGLPAGGWVKFYGECAMAQKWVEAKVLSKSYNFARPCGQDRVAMDETTVRCAFNYDADAFDVNASTEISVGDYVALCGVDGIADGIYQILDANPSKDHFTLDSEVGKIADYDIDRDCGSGIVGKVRFPNAPALCARIDVVTATQHDADVDIVLAADATWLRVGDSIDFDGVPGLGSNVIVQTRTDATHISVTGTLTASPASGGYISSHGAAAYYWNDIRMKGDFIAATWTWHGRDWRERSRVIDLYDYDPQCGSAPSSTQIREHQQFFHRDISAFSFEDLCSGWDACRPMILGSVPAGQEDTTSWVCNHSFPSLQADARYGWFWQGAYYQLQPDWMWQEPYPTCAFEAPVDPWVMDTGACTGDYPNPPWVEARATLPSNGGLDEDETPPVGVFHKVYSLAELDTAATLPDTPLYPPAATNYDLTSAYLLPANAITPWGIYLAKEQCVCGEGVFAAQYRKDGVQCPV